MICQICGKNTATTHIKRTVNGVTTEHYVCSACAKENGFFSANTLNMNSLFGEFLPQSLFKEKDSVAVCELCGTSYRTILRNGRVGCPQCYATFSKQLEPSIQRIHGKTSHVGKIGAAGETTHSTARELDTLKAELAKAVTAQEFERCAELRDRIRALEEGMA